MTEDENVVTEFFMPCGDDVAVLLSQPALTDAFIRGLLRERGVFSNQNERSQLIEHFVLSYLSATEFDAIVEKLATLEESFKLRTDTHTLATQSIPLTVMVPKPTELNVKEVAKDPKGNFIIEGSPSFVKNKTGEFVLEYTLRRQNVGRNWIRSQERFPGKIILGQSEDKAKLRMKLYHSSSETKSVNQELKRWICKDLRSRDIIKSNSGKSIEFGDFTHEQRMSFFVRFTRNYAEENFKFEKVTDFDFRVDDQLVPAGESRISWMKGTVSRSSLRGKALHDLFILRERETWKFIKLWYIELRFKLSNADFDGGFSLFLEFDGYGHSGLPTSKFHFSVGPISSRKYRDSTENIRRRTQEQFDQYVQRFADEVLAQP